MISIHAPREGSDKASTIPKATTTSFLSTLPARGATIIGYQEFRVQDDFYPRSPRGERPAAPRHGWWGRSISIHAPREGSDYTLHPQNDRVLHFYPRSPRGERPACAGQEEETPCISIHAPREGSDIYSVCKIIALQISIHAPREGSDYHGSKLDGQNHNFYPRSP